MEHLNPLITDLALVLIVAAITTILFKWMKQPVVLGYIVAGYLVSNHFPFMPNLHDIKNINTLAEMGIIFLLFGLGLEFSFKKLMNVGGSAMASALVIVIGMMITGFSVGKLMGWNSTDSLFLGGMLSMSSTTIIIKAFKDLGLRGQKFTSVVFGVLVVEDLFAIIMMVILTTLYVGQSVEGEVLVWSIVKLVFFLVVWFGVGIYLIPSMIKRAKKYLNSETLLIISLGLCLGMVVLAAYVGFSAALGAFIMGSILAETVEVKAIEKVTQPIRDLFGAVFFVSVGMLVDPSILAGYWLPILILTAVVIIGQISFASIGMLISGQTLRVSIQSGFSLAQIGEFAFIIATLGVSLGVTSKFLYPVAVAVSVITTFATPFIMRMADPVYNRLERRLPPRLRTIIDNYSSGTVTAATHSHWRLLLKEYIQNVVILSIILSGLVWIISVYLIPFITSHLDGTLGRITATTISLLLIAPFIWGLTIRRISPRIFIKLWTNSHFNRGFLISLVVLRVFVALVFIMAVIINIYSFRTGALIGISLITFILLVFSKRIQKGWLHFESQFLGNLEDPQKIKRIGLNSNHLHITSIRVSPESDFAGLSLGEARLRQQHQVTIVSIKRGVKVINTPDAAQRLLPLDEISVIGTDAALRRFGAMVEFHNEDVIPQSHSPIIMKQFWLDNSPSLIGQTIAGSGIRHEFECMVIGVERRNGESIEPMASVEFQSGDTIWFAGEKAKIEKLIERYK